MKYNRILITTILLAMLLTLVSCGGGGGGGQKLLAGKIVNEAATALSGAYSVQGSGLIGSIGADGTFAAEVPKSGMIILTGTTGTFRLKRVPFNTELEGGLNLGNVILPNDSLSKGWHSYRTGDVAGAITNFQAQINAGGRDIADAYNGLGWAQARNGDVDNAHTNLSKALGSNFDDEVRTGMAAAAMGRAIKGTAQLADVISNLDLAISATGTYLSQPVHDRVSEDDLIALRAMMNYLDGRTQAAITDRNNVSGKTDSKMNAASVDLLEVLDYFLSE